MKEAIFELDKREEDTMVSSWTVYLCAKLSNDRLKICHMQREVLGWSEDYVICDEEGHLVTDELPKSIDGKDVFGTEDGAILGHKFWENSDSYDWLDLNLNEKYQSSLVREFLTSANWNVKNEQKIKKLFQSNKIT